ncbi:hypothetical protein OSTOST_08803 [Ostertagia ostertagi]
MMEPAGDACCGATARALDMFNRRGSVIAVVIGDMETLGSIDPQSDWRPPYPRLIAFHDCLSLASAWSLGLNPSLLDDRPTGASQAQSPCEDDSGDGKSNEMLASCPAFRNELGASRHDGWPSLGTHAMVHWKHTNHTAAAAGILEDVSNVYLGGRLCAARQPKNVIEPQDIGSYYYRHCFAGRAHVEYFGVDDELGPIAVSMELRIMTK